jgi:hypothetical protein
MSQTGLVSVVDDFRDLLCQHRHRLGPMNESAAVSLDLKSGARSSGTGIAFLRESLAGLDRAVNSAQ